MFMRMIYDEKLAQAAYLIGCPESGEAVLFDPLRDVDQYIDLATEHELEIVAVAETHIHADFVSGARELAERAGAHVYVSGEGGEEWRSHWLDDKVGGGSYPHTQLHDGDSFTIAGIEFRALHTPGHTPEHVAYLVTDLASGATEPIGLVSGDFLFVGDLGRPDLLETAAGRLGMRDPAARALFGTLPKLDRIPEFVQIWPGHGSGSACGKALGAVPMSTIGYERRFNPALLAASSESSFVEYILTGQPEPPMYFAAMKRVNRDGPAVLDGLPEPRLMTPGEIAGLDPQAVAIVDTREWDVFRAGHIPGSLSFPVVQSFCTDAGSLVREDEQIYIVADPDELEGVIRDLVRIGLDRIVGWCPAYEIDSEASGGVASATIDEITIEQAREGLQPGEAVLDVRRRNEFDEGRIPGSTNISHTRLMTRLDEIPSAKRLLINCRSGKRSARACAYLKRLGHDVINIEGGILAWHDAGADVEC